MSVKPLLPPGYNNLTKQIKSCKPLLVTTYDIFWYKPVDIEQ